MEKKKTNIKSEQQDDAVTGSGVVENYETLIIHGTKFKTLLTKKYLNRKKYQPVNEMHEISFIPGTILELYVKDGNQVKKNEPLLILEAMKMENTIFAPFDCTVKKVHIKVGEVLPKGTLLLEYEV
jgi:biotin carboxyl carrier protein